jgi:hypothetical protein
MQVAEPTRETTSPRLLRSPAFFCTWLSRITSGIGDAFTAVCLPLLVLHLSDDSLVLASTLAANAIPRMLFLLVGGAVADLTSPLRLVQITSFCQALVAFTVSLLAIGGALEIWVVYLTSFAAGCLGALGGPSGPVLVSRVVERAQLPAANSLLRSSSQIVESGGPLLVGIGIGVLVAHLSPLTAYGTAFLVDSASFVIAFALLLFVSRIRPDLMASGTAHRSASALLRSVRDGYAYVFGQRAALMLLLFAATSELFTLGCLTAGLPLIANASGSSAENLGVLLFGLRIGTFIGTLLSGFLARFAIAKWLYLLMLGAALRGLSFIGIGAVVDSVLIVTIVACVVGVVRSFNVMLVLNLIQRIAAPALMGRVISVFTSTTALMAPLSIFGFSLLERQIGLGGAYMVLGSANALVLVLLLSTDPLREEQPA